MFLKLWKNKNVDKLWNDDDDDGDDDDDNDDDDDDGGGWGGFVKRGSKVNIVLYGLMDNRNPILHLISSKGIYFMSVIFTDFFRDVPIY